MADFAQVLGNGLIAGSIYALIAVGYTMVYGVQKFINFAHGDAAMIGAYLAFSSLALVSPRHPGSHSPRSLRRSRALCSGWRSSASHTARCARPRA